MEDGKLVSEENQVQQKPHALQTINIVDITVTKHNAKETLLNPASCGRRKGFL